MNDRIPLMLVVVGMHPPVMHYVHLFYHLLVHFFEHVYWHVLAFPSFVAWNFHNLLEKKKKKKKKKHNKFF
jgi:hypothetical protein